MFDGDYAYRFDGFSMDAVENPHRVVGIGVMTLTWDATQDKGVISGRQTSTATPLAEGRDLNVEAFTLSGEFQADTLPQYSAKITFTSTDTDGGGKPNQVLVGTFSLVPVGDYSRFWLISTGAISNGSTVDEVVTGEGVKLQLGG